MDETRYVPEELPTVLKGTCGDCGTTVTLEHEGGIGGGGSGQWICPVCIHRLTMTATQDPTP